MKTFSDFLLLKEEPAQPEAPTQVPTAAYQPSSRDAPTSTYSTRPTPPGGTSLNIGQSTLVGDTLQIVGSDGQKFGLKLSPDQVQQLTAKFQQGDDEESIWPDEFRQWDRNRRMPQT